MTNVKDVKIFLKLVYIQQYIKMTLPNMFNDNCLNDIVVGYFTMASVLLSVVLLKILIHVKA